VPKPNPGKPGDDKNKHENNERNSFDSQQFHHAAHAYVHVPVEILFLRNKIFYAGIRITR
jgi:hypothetical protein